MISKRKIIRAKRKLKLRLIRRMSKENHGAIHKVKTGGCSYCKCTGSKIPELK